MTDTLGCSRGRSVLSRQLLHPLAGVVLNAHAHQLAELMRPFVGKGVAGEVALPLSGHESSVQQHAQMLGNVTLFANPARSWGWERLWQDPRSRATSTLGCERGFNGALKLALNDGDAFVREILSGQPEPPLYFATMKRVNRDGIAVTIGAPKPPRLNAAEFSRVPTARLSRFSMRETIGKHAEALQQGEIIKRATITFEQKPSQMVRHFRLRLMR